MPSLRDTQVAFCAAIRSEDAGAAAGLILADGIDAEQRVQIYRNNHRLGALAALQATYPVIERLGGSEWFRQSALRFLQDHPSRCGDLQYLGEDYPGFLRKDLAGSPHAYFADVAALEWAYQRVLTAAEREPVELRVLQAVDPQDYERLCFGPVPALDLVESPFPVFAIWHANQSAMPAQHAIRLDAGASRVLLIRRSDHVELRELAQPTCLLLRQFRQGATLGDAAEAVAAEAGDFDLQGCLRELLGLGTIADIGLTAGEHR
jgi:hypothetical protein